jgi:hypothetical protein
MTPWTFDVKFSRGTQFTFGSLTFAAGEDGDLKMLPPGPTPEHLALASPSVSGGSCSGSNPYAGLYIHTIKLVRGIPVVTSILRLHVGASSSSSSASTPDLDSSDDYTEIRTSACGEPAEDGHLICMVAPNGDQSHNSSSKYPTIGISEVSDAWMPSGGLDQNLNPDFNAVWVQAIIETIQCMVPDGSPLVVLAQQGIETVNLVVVEKLVGVPRREPSVNDNDRARCARSEAALSASPIHRLSAHDARQSITQNRTTRGYGYDRDDLRNVIEDWRWIRLRTSSPPRRSLVEDIALVGKGGFRTLAGPLRQVRWPDKFKTGNIDRYDGSSNPEEFIQVY